MSRTRQLAWLPAIALATALPSVASAGKNTPHDPNKLAAYSSATRFEVPADAKYAERRGIGVLLEQGVKAGRYVARFQDAAGFYYFGEGKSVCQANPKCGDFDRAGGIWVSKKDASDVRIFLVQPPPGPSAINFGIIIEALARKDIGKLFVFPPNPAFARQLASFERE